MLLIFNYYALPFLFAPALQAGVNKKELNWL